jgi:hypothetical protein
MLMYGLPGSYKTRTAYTAALDKRTAPVLSLNCAGNPVSTRDYTSRPDIINMEDLEDFNDPFDWITAGQSPTSVLAKQFDLHPPYKTLIIDQITETQRMYFDRVMGVTRGKLKVAEVPIKREWDHYNTVLQSMIKFSRWHFDLPINVIMIAQERESNTEEGRPIGPLLEGQSFQEVTSYAELLVRIQVVPHCDTAIRKLLEKDHPGATHVMWLKPNNKYMAKNQYGGDTSYIINPTLTTLLDKINLNLT